MGGGWVGVVVLGLVGLCVCACVCWGGWGSGEETRPVVLPEGAACKAAEKCRVTLHPELQVRPGCFTACIVTVVARLYHNSCMDSCDAAPGAAGPALRPAGRVAVLFVSRRVK